MALRLPVTIIELPLGRHLMTLFGEMMGRNDDGGFYFSCGSTLVDIDVWIVNIYLPNYLQ